MQKLMGSRYSADVVFAVLLAVVALINLQGLGGEFDPVTDGPAVRAPDTGAVLVNLALTIPLIWRRRVPATVLAVVLGAFMVDRIVNYPATLGIFALAFAYHAVGSDLPRDRSLRVGAIGIAIAVGFTLTAALDSDVNDVDWTAVVSMASISVFPFVLGREIFTTREAGRQAAYRAHEAEATREAAALRAVQDERTRIARELHDVVAHQITVMTLQAGAAKRQMGRDDKKAAVALEAIEASGREGLSEMRRLLALLRPEEAESSRHPQPGLARLDDLVAQMTEAGIDVDVVVEGSPRDLPTGIEVNAYRIIQESLTNTLKHGGPDVRATVTLEFDDDALTVHVVDTGRGAASRIDASNNGSGLGLVGMKERVALLNGTLVAEPERGGGFRVSVYLPTDAP
jgi:signal transduction histidine kinase